MEMVSIKSPNPSSAFGQLRILNRASASGSFSPMTFLFSPSLRRRPLFGGVSLAAPKGLAPIDRRISFNQTSVAFAAASHEESEHSEIEVEREKDEAKLASEAESNEEWKQALEAFKEQALKMYGVSQEAFQTYTEKALITLEETSERLKIQAEKAKNDLTEILREIGKEGKVYLSTAAENSPPEVKEIVESFYTLTPEVSDIDTVLDYQVGIPYGFILSVSGFLSFMVTGSISAVRFGVILGGALLAISISSLRAHKRGETSFLPTKGLLAISSIIFSREIYLLLQKFTLGTFLTTLISGLVVAFYIKKLLPLYKRGLESGTEH